MREENNNFNFEFDKLTFKDMPKIKEKKGRSSSGHRSSASRQSINHDHHDTFKKQLQKTSPIVKQQIINGSIQTIYKGPEDGLSRKIGYRVKFVVKVPASAIDKIHVDVIDDGNSIAVTQFYSPNLLKESLVLHDAFGGFERNSTASMA